jgi:hypothetical protein
VTGVLAIDPVLTEERFLAQLRRRVAWQAEQASRQRAESVADHASAHDPLDPNALRALIETRPDDPRAPEWRAFLNELDILIEDDGRLPAMVEGLVRLVFADLL